MIVGLVEAFTKMTIRCPDEALAQPLKALATSKEKACDHPIQTRAI
jgi:hypothetical protein